MHNSLWTIKPCPQADAAELARELDVSETTARVLLRRGYDSAKAAKAFLEGELPAWLAELPGLVCPVKVPHFTRFRCTDDTTGVELWGSPDEIFLCAGLIINEDIRHM